MAKTALLTRVTANLALVKTYIAHSVSKYVKIIEYRTADEGLCSAYFFTIERQHVENELEAFVQLWSHQIHLHNEWDTAQTTLENAAFILNHWLLPEMTGFYEQFLSAQRLHQEIGGVMQSINQYWLTCHECSDNQGVFVDGQLVAKPSLWTDLGLAPQSSGMGLEVAWNGLEIFYDTATHYVLFSWGTGA